MTADRDAGTMPEFVMPVEPPAGPPAASAPPELDERPAPGVTALHPSELEPREHPPVRPRRPWRQLIAAGAIGVVVGAAIPGGFQAVERSAAAADRAGLEALALEYVTAIAEGRADDATALVPPSAPGGAPLLVDAVLATAQRIGEPAVGVVQIDGDSARVDVRFRSSSGERTRTLEAERAAEGWTIRTSLAEPVLLYDMGFGAAATIAGVALDPVRPSLLYPGIYTTDEQEDEWVRVEPGQVRVDGDPTTPSEVMLSTEVVPELSEAATEEALRRAAACAADPACDLPADARFEGIQPAYLSGMNGPDSIELGVAIGVTSGTSGSGNYQVQHVDVPVRVQRAADGTETWECLEPNAYMTGGSSFEWGPCG